VITDDKALLWTDARYFVQAEKELDPQCWTLMREGNKDVLPISQWLNRVESIAAGRVSSAHTIRVD
jgi:Xaa-Pro aminopeptidase